MRIAVIGTGAIGGYFGGRLAAAGEEVVFVARGENLRALRARGLKVESPQGDFAVSRLNVTDNLSGIGSVDLVLVGVKAWQVPEVAPALGPLIGDDTAILPLQNGVEASGLLAAEHGERHVLAGMCRIVSMVVKPGHIRHLGVEPCVVFGELDGRSSGRVTAIMDVFEGAGVGVESPADIWASIWGKFAFIASFGGVGAVARAPAGVMRSTPGTRELLELAMREVCAVAVEKNVTLSHDTVDKAMAFLDGMPLDATSSMQRDIMNGRPSELESQNGAVVRIGKETGVATPVHRFIYNALLPMETLARG